MGNDKGINYIEIAEQVAAFLESPQGQALIAALLGLLKSGHGQKVADAVHALYSQEVSPTTSVPTA